MRKPRVVHFTSSLKMGGAETVLYNLVKQLRSDFDQTVIYVHEGPFVQKIKALGIPAHKVTGLFLRYDPFFFYQLYRLLKQMRPDCLHTLLWIANVSGRIMGHILGIRTVCVMHNNVNQNGAVRNILDSVTLAYADNIVTVSSEVKQSVLTRHNWFPSSRIKVIKNGIDAKQVHQQSMNNAVTHRALGLSKDLFIFGSVGRFEPVKNYSLLIAAFAHVADEKSHLLLVGVGSEERKLKEQVHRLNIADNVTFIVNEPSYRYLSLFDCFVMSSSQEGISMALLEAMSCKIPPIVTHAFTTHEVIEHDKSGLLVSAHDCKGLTQAMRTLMLDNNKYQQLAAGAQQQIVQKFDEQTMIDAYRTMLSFLK